MQIDEMIEQFRENRSIFEMIYYLIDVNDSLHKELDAKTEEHAEVVAIANRLRKENDQLRLANVQMKRDAYNMQMFIEENVPEEKKNQFFK